MKHEIKNRWSGKIIFEYDADSMRLAAEEAVQSNANLGGANLIGADLSGADLGGADLSRADLRRANLCNADLGSADLRGTDLRDASLIGADLSNVNLRGADLRGTDLRDASLIGADLSGADLRGADLGGADLSGANPRNVDLDGVPKIENIHQAVYVAASKPDALNMGNWHSCETTHCRAGWVVALAGEAGKAMEWCLGTPAAAALIYMRSDPKLERVPDFYASNEEALADMKKLAELEASK